MELGPQIFPRSNARRDTCQGGDGESASRSPPCCLSFSLLDSMLEFLRPVCGRFRLTFRTRVAAGIDDPDVGSVEGRSFGNLPYGKRTDQRSIACSQLGHGVAAEIGRASCRERV